VIFHSYVKLPDGNVMYGMYVCMYVHQAQSMRMYRISPKNLWLSFDRRENSKKNWN
jgi:hypothetical protein